MESAEMPMLLSSSSRNFSAAPSVWMNVHLRLTSDGRSITAGQGQQARDFPLNIKHSLYHDGNILRGFSSVQLTLRDFTFHRPHHVQTLSKKTLELSYSQRILLRIRLTGLTVSSLLCKLKYFFSIFSFKVIIQSGFGNRLISCRLNKFWP